MIITFFLIKIDLLFYIYSKIFIITSFTSEMALVSKLISSIVYGTIGLIKGAICFIPCTPYFTAVTTGMTLVRLPENVYRAYKALYNTKLIGPTLKTLVSILLPIPIVLTIPVSVIGSCLFSGLYSLFVPLFGSIAEGLSDDHRHNTEWGSMSYVFSNLFSYYPSHFWHHWTKGYDNLATGFENTKLQPGETPYDVPLLWIPLGLLYGLGGFVIDGLASALIGVVKVIPAIIRMVYELWRLYTELDFEAGVFLLIPFILAHAVAVILAVCGLVLLPIAGGIIGMSAAGSAYRRGLWAGVQRIAHTIYDVDEWTNRLIFKTSSWFPCLKMGEDLFGA